MFKMFKMFKTIIFNKIKLDRTLIKLILENKKEEVIIIKIG